MTGDQMALGVQRQPEKVSTGRDRSVRAFTMVDVLVSMAVIAVLMSLLMPTLSSVRETARQVVCRSNVRQIGIGLTQFAGDRADHLPHSIYTDSTSNYKPWETVSLRIMPGPAWDGLGLLYSEEYTPAPRVFYCPSHRGQHPYAAYEDAWGGDQGAIVGNFQYRGRAPMPGSTALSDRLSALPSYTTLIADGFRTQSDFNHDVGASTFGANLFRADSSVAWFTEHPGSVIDSLPKDVIPNGTLPGEYDQVWQELDRR